MTTSPRGSPPKNTWRDRLGGLGNVGCMLASAAIGGLIAIAGIVAMFAGIELVARWLMVLLWNRVSAAVLGVALMMLGGWAVIRVIQRRAKSGVGLGGRILALVVWAGFAIVGVILLIAAFSAAPGSSGF
jgi:hypothetical protein